MSLYKYAIVRRPGLNFAYGLTTNSEGSPIYEKALLQHESYCDALRSCGLLLTNLEADLRYPDSTFVEDTAILTEQSAILTHPGARSREGEVGLMKETLAHFYKNLYKIKSPGKLDGGDVCQADNHFFIGISQRTNRDGAQQLAGFLGQDGYSSTIIDIRKIKNLLHLKSGMAYLSDKNILMIDTLADILPLQDYEIIRVPGGEEYAANCIRINDKILLADGYPKTKTLMQDLGYTVMTLDMSEFRKMDGGLSCLSLRF
jgi:dimethylargininase